LDTTEPNQIIKIVALKLEQNKSNVSASVIVKQRTD